MRNAVTTLGTPDETGVHHLNQHTAGCPHCGFVDVKFEPTGKVALWHPGAECCEARIQDQIRWRRGEIASINHELDQAKQNLNAKVEARDFKGDLHLATETLERKAMTRINALGEEIKEFGGKLNALRKTA